MAWATSAGALLRIQALALRELAVARLSAGQLDGAHEAAARGLALVGADDVVPRSFLVRTLGHVYHARGQGRAELAPLEDEYEPACAVGGLAANRIGMALAATLVDVGEVDRGRALLEVEAQRAAELGNMATALIARVNLANQEPDHLVAERELLAAQELALRARRDDLAATACLNVGLRRHVRGELTGAIRAYCDAIQWFARRDQLLWATSSAWCALAEAESGDRSAAGERLAEVGPGEGLGTRIVGLVRAATDRDWATWQPLAGEDTESPVTETVVLTARLRDDGSPAAP